MRRPLACEICKCSFISKWGPPSTLVRKKKTCLPKTELSENAFQIERCWSLRVIVLKCRQKTFGNQSVSKIWRHVELDVSFPGYCCVFKFLWGSAGTAHYKAGQPLFLNMLIVTPKPDFVASSQTALTDTLNYQFINSSSDFRGLFMWIIFFYQRLS